MQQHSETENVRRGVTAIIFDNNGGLYFLILHRVLNWTGWEFVKGGIDEGETAEKAVVREIFEETGLSKFSLHKRIDEPFTFLADGKTYSFEVFLFEASMNAPIFIERNRDKEHDTYLWATKDSVLEKLTYEGQKKLFLNAIEEVKKLVQEAKA